MGNQSSDSSNSFHHPRLGKLIKRQDTMLLYVPMRCAADYKDWLNYLHSYKFALLQEPVLLPKNSCQIQQRINCSQQVIIQIQLDYFPFTLEQEIQSRTLKQIRFSEKEILFTLDALVRAASSFQKLGIRGADIRPKNILLNSSGCIKVLTTFADPCMKIGYFQMLQKNEKAYLSPQEFRQLAFQYNTGKVSLTAYTPKNMTYSIGLTLLEMIVLQKIEQCINSEDFGIKMELIQAYKKAVSNSPQLSLLVKNLILLTLQPQKSRPLPSHLFELMKQLNQQQQGDNLSNSTEQSKRKGLKTLNVKRSFHKLV